ncbi:MAG TPA: aminotransferase class I/II-fold pyridoxal phosphate-dependent enzyme, partial [Candidatus Nitrosotenuis sp.]
IRSTTHIIPIVIGDEKTTLEFGKYLYDGGVFAQPIRYPTVAKNSARIRVSVTAWLSKKQIEHALYTFEKAGKKFRIL